MLDNAKLAHDSILEIEVYTTDPEVEHIKPGDVEIAVIDIYIVRDDNKVHPQALAVPRLLAQIAQGQALWFAHRHSEPTLTFQVSAENIEQGIPPQLPADLRASVARMSRNCFELIGAH
jgi:hypothetical protein